MKLLFPASKTDEESQAQHQCTPSPPRNCPGYPPALIPTDFTEEEQIDFYLPNGNERLACSLLLCLQGNRKAWSYVPSIGVHVDSTKPVIVICHGFMSWRNQMLLTHIAGGLCKKMNCHTLRFDFTGNGHSSGAWRYGNFGQEAKDLNTVIEFANQEMKCNIACVVGHSKATYAVLRIALQQEATQVSKIPSFCILSGRYSLPGEFDTRQRFSEAQLKEFECQGKVIIGIRGSRRFEIFQRDIDERAELDSSKCKDIESSVVLIVHGDADMTVNVSSATRFKESIPNSEIYIVKGADHSFNGLRHMQELVSIISAFVNKAASDRC